MFSTWPAAWLFSPSRKLWPHSDTLPRPSPIDSLTHETWGSAHQFTSNVLRLRGCTKPVHEAPNMDGCPHHDHRLTSHGGKATRTEGVTLVTLMLVIADMRTQLETSVSLPLHMCQAQRPIGPSRRCRAVLGAAALGGRKVRHVNY